MDVRFPQDFGRCPCGTLDLREQIRARFGCGTCGNRDDFKQPHPEIVSFMEWLKIKIGWFGFVDGLTWRVMRPFRRRRG